MRIVLIYRNGGNGAHSIEEIFHSLALEFAKHATVIEYQLGPRKSIITDIVKLRRLKADIYHITGDVHYVACFLPKRKTVLTIHDIYNYLNKLKGLKKILYKWIWLILPIYSAKIITVVSVETKRMLESELKIINKPIYVVHNCYNENVFKVAAKEFQQDSPILLQVGTGFNKNVLRLIEAIQGLTCTLYIIGVLTEPVLETLRKNKIQYKNFVNLTHQEVYEKYVQSDIVIFASVYEGFGMPILEGNAVGRVVVTSNIEPMISVSGNSACLVDPFSTSSIKAAIRKIITNAQYRNALVEYGFNNAKNYSISSIALQYYNLYQGVLS